MRYAALLRGINVGGNAKIVMADLRALLEGLGYDDVVTLLQSGNAVFTASKPRAADIEDAIGRQLGLDVTVLLRSATELRRVVDDNPFPAAVKEPKNLHVGFLSAPPASVEIDADAIAPDRVAFGAREMYVWYANGMARSQVGKHASEKKLGVRATARNWNTVTKLVALAEG